MQIKVGKLCFKPNLSHSSEIIYPTATVISPVTIIHKEKSHMPLKWELNMQKEIEVYRGELFIFEEMGKSITVIIKKARKNTKYEITSTDDPDNKRKFNNNPNKKPSVSKIR